MVVVLALVGGVAFAIVNGSRGAADPSAEVERFATTSTVTTTTTIPPSVPQPPPPPPPPSPPPPAPAPCAPAELLATANQQTATDGSYSDIADVACSGEWASANLYSTTTEWTDSGALFERVNGFWMLRSDGISPFCPSELERYGAPSAVANALASSAGCEDSFETVPESEFVDSGPCTDPVVQQRFLERYADSLDAVLAPFPLLEGGTERTQFGQSTVYICLVLFDYSSTESVVDYIYFGINDPGPIALWATPVGGDFVASNNGTTYTVSDAGLSVSGTFNFFQPWSYFYAE
jgi:hypothetical protein